MACSRGRQSHRLQSVYAVIAMRQRYFFVMRDWRPTVNVQADKKYEILSKLCCGAASGGGMIYVFFRVAESEGSYIHKTKEARQNNEERGQRRRRMPSIVT